MGRYFGGIEYSDLSKASARVRREVARIQDFPFHYTAKEYRVSDGEWIVVENNHGSAKFVTKMSEAVQEKMVQLEHGWWFPEKEAKAPSLFGAFEANCNNLCPDEDQFVSREIGTWPHTALLCRIRKLEGG